MRSPALAAIVFAATTPTIAASLTDAERISRVQAYVAARDGREYEKARSLLAPGARVWYEKKEGGGEAIRPGAGRWIHWDTYFHGRTSYAGWRVEDGAVVATVRETSDFYRLLDWKPAPMRFAWWVDETGRVSGFLVQALPETEPTGSRFEDAVAWAKTKHREEIAYLMPKGHLDPAGDRAERWERLLVEWRRQAGLPEVKLEGPRD